jgi:hypothetical protein
LCLNWYLLVERHRLLHLLRKGLLGLLWLLLALVYGELALLGKHLLVGLIILLVLLLYHVEALIVIRVEVPIFLMVLTLLFSFDIFLGVYGLFGQLNEGL